MNFAFVDLPYLMSFKRTSIHLSLVGSQWEFCFVKYLQNKYAMLMKLDDMQCILPVFEI